jgi:aminopeptidase N
MDTWILQGGHPVLHVDRGVATQSPFSFGPAEGPSNIGATWKIPVHAMSLADGAETSTMLAEEPVDLGVGATCVANTGWGFYRTHYDARGFAALRSGFGSLTELQRGVLLSDTWALARSGTVAVADVLELARALAPVPEPSAWRTVESVLSTLDRIVGDELRDRYEVTVRNLVGPLFDRIGWEPSDREDGPTGLVRSIAVRVLGTLARDASVRERAAARFDSGELDGDLADAIVSVVASMARLGDRDEMLARMRRAATPQIADRYRNGVAAYADEVLGVATMRSCFELFRLHEVPLVVPRLVSNRVAGRAVWRALTEDWAAVVARTQPAMQYALALGVASFIDDPAFADDVTRFHRSHPLEGGQQRVEQSLEMMHNGVAFAAQAGPTLTSALD